MVRVLKIEDVAQRVEGTNSFEPFDLDLGIEKIIKLEVSHQEGGTTLVQNIILKRTYGAWDAELELDGLSLMNLNGPQEVLEKMQNWLERIAKELKDVQIEDLTIGDLVKQ
tara:strand:- start:455 stop:787 length:333 start_codon:yes stop_codon:yes gene_type:complete